ncbi:MAG: DMT family transporter [Dehalobacterium sp.]
MGETKALVSLIKSVRFKANPAQEEKTKTFIRGTLQMLISAVFCSLMVYFAKLATQTVPSAEVTFFRLSLGVLVALMMVKRHGHKLITANTRVLLLRGFFGGITVLLYFMAIEKGTITNTTVLQNTFPIFAVLLSFYFLKEKVTFRALWYMMITFIGIILLIRPDLGNVKIGDLLALASGIVGGFAVIAIRQLRQNNESVWTIFFYFCIFGAVLSFCLAIPQWKIPLLKEALFILLTSLAGLISQVTMTSAYKYCSTILGGILSMSSSIFSFLLGVLLLHEQVRLLDLTGIFLITAGSILVVVYEDIDAQKENCHI